jgi:hypothetical membrane protein
MPVIYFATQIASVLLNPGFDIATQQPSELGMAEANYPIVANVGFLGTGICAILGGVGLFAGLRAIGGNIILAALAALGMILFGVAMTMSGAFPLPNPLHYGFGLFPAGILAPLFGGLAFKNGGAARTIVLLAFVASLGLLLCLTVGANVIATEANQGLFSRGIALIAFPAIGYLCWAVSRRLKA